MSEAIKYTSVSGTIHHGTRYTREEIAAAWESEGQGHETAIERGGWCVIVPCQEREVALQLSAAFVRCVFAIPTCCHWNGTTLSLYCGDAGHGAPGAKANCEKLVETFMECDGWWAHESGPLFAN